MNKKIVLLAFVSILLLSGCVPVVSAHSVERPHEMVVATIGEPETVDPAWLYDTASAELVFNVYETLIFFDVDRTRPPAEAGLVDQFVPSLATEWSVSLDDMTYTFRMRDNVMWHDGAISTAAEMARHAEYSFERWMVQDRAGGSTWMILEPLLGVYRTELTAEFAQAIDNAVLSFTDDTGSYVQFNFVMPHPAFLSIIAQPWASILSRDWCVAQGCFPGFEVTGYDPAVWGEWNDPDVSELDDPVPVMMGTGPYMFDYWMHVRRPPIAEWSIVRHADYWGGWPALECGNGYSEGWIERATVKNIPEWVDRKLGFLAGDYDIVYVPRMHIPELVLNWPEEDEEYVPGIRCFKDLSQLVCGPAMFFNFDISSTSPYMGVPGGLPPSTFDETGIPPDFFNDIDVRKGFAYAFDYTEYIEDVYWGEASRGTTPVVEGLPYHNPAQEGYIFNLTAAEEHFRAAWGGQVWTKGFTMAVAVNVGSVPRGTYIDILKAGVESLSPKFQIEKVEVLWPTFLEQLVNQELPIFTLGFLGDYSDPHAFVYAFMHTEPAFPYFQSVRYGQSGRKQIVYYVNGISYGNPALVINNAYVNQMIDHGIMTWNRTERQVIYYELQAIYHDEVPSVPLSQLLGRQWERDWVQGWYYNPAYPGEYFYHLWKGYLGDTDKDYCVDLTDIYNVLMGYGLSIEEAMARYGVPLGTDVDEDGRVDIDDLYWVLINYD